MKYLVIFTFAILLASCQKEELPCKQYKNCHYSIYTFQTCDDGKTFTDVQIIPSETGPISSCTMDDLKSQRLQRIESDPNTNQFYKTHPEIMDCHCEE